MPEAANKPVEIASKLADNPRQNPKYYREVQLKNGTTLKVADPKATRALVALMDMQSVIGGAASHYGGPAAFAELMSAIHGLAFYQSDVAEKKWYELFNLINDAGHCENGLYALKSNYGFNNMTLTDLKGFRSIDSVLTGHGESHLFPQGVFLSNGPLGSALPQSQGLAMADALSGNNRVTITAISDGASMEGEAKEAFAAIPGYAAKGQLAPFVMVVSDNNTKLSGRIDADSFSMQPTFASLESLGWKTIKVEDGHDLQACTSALEEAIEFAKANAKKPVAVWAKTVKGKGTKATEESSSGGHGFPLSKPDQILEFVQEIYGEQKAPEEFVQWANEMNANYNPAAKKDSPVKNEKMQVGVAQAMINCRKSGIPVISLSSDLAGSTGVKNFQREFPQASFDLGVAEANMVSAGAGFSKMGYVPVVDTFSQFGITKGALPMIMANLSQAPVIAVFSHIGFQDAADGASHQALTYFSMMSAIPNVEVYCLSCSSEAKALLTQAIEKFHQDRLSSKTPKSYVFFLGRENFPQYFSENVEYKLGEAQVLFDSSGQWKQSVCIAATGTVIPQALQAAQLLQEREIGAVVVNPSAINYPDVDGFAQFLKGTSSRLVTVEDHRVTGGFGAILTHALAQNGIPARVKSLGVASEFGQSAYKAQQLYSKHGMDGPAIAQAAEQILVN